MLVTRTAYIQNITLQLKCCYYYIL